MEGLGCRRIQLIYSNSARHVSVLNDKLVESVQLQ